MLYPPSGCYVANIKWGQSVCADMKQYPRYIIKWKEQGGGTIYMLCYHLYKKSEIYFCEYMCRNLPIPWHTHRAGGHGTNTVKCWAIACQALVQFAVTYKGAHSVQSWGHLWAGQSRLGWEDIVVLGNQVGLADGSHVEQSENLALERAGSQSLGENRGASGDHVSVWTCHERVSP